MRQLILALLHIVSHLKTSRVDYDFMVISTDSSSNESSEFLTMNQQVIFRAFSFTGGLEFVFESSIPPLAG